MARRNVTPGEFALRQPGLIESLQAIFRGILDYVLVRFELAGLESKVAFQKAIKGVAALCVGLIGLFAGVLYLSLSLVYVLATFAGWGWGYALLASGIIMLLITATGLLLAKKFLEGAWFPTTISELKKDTEWLKQNSTPNA